MPDAVLFLKDIFVSVFLMKPLILILLIVSCWLAPQTPLLLSFSSIRVE